MSFPLPQPDQYSDWRDWAKAITAQISVGLETPDMAIVETTPTPPPDEFENITIYDNLGRIILNPEGLWIWDPYGALPVAPGVFAIDTQHLVNAAITTAKLQDLSVDVSKLAALSVDASKLIDGSVTTTKIANLAVGTAAIAIAAVGTAQIANAAVLSAQIGDLQVTTGKINDLAVNEGKIANAAISSAKIQDLAVTNAKISNGAIDAVKIGAAVINRTHIQDGEIVNAKIADTIQSSTWNDLTKQGWRINKLGQIEGSSIAIYDQYGYLVFGANVPSYSNANLVRNGDFRDNLNWWVPYDGQGISTISLVSSSTGSPAVRLSWSVPSTSWPKGIAQIQAATHFVPGQTYTVSFLARAETVGGSAPIMGLHWNIGPEELIALENPAINDSWQRYVFRFRFGAAIEYAALYIGLTAEGATGYVEYDQIQMEIGPWATEWKENLSDASEQALWGSITGAGKPADNADVTSANIAAGIIGQGALATQSAVSLETQVLGLLANSNVSGLGALALINQLTGGNINTYIQAAAISTALIADGAIVNAKIGNGEINSAKIADASISTAKIADASITDAKIVNLNASKLNAGEINTDLLKIDGVTLDTDGSGNLIIKNAGVNSQQLAQNALIVPYSYSQIGSNTVSSGFWGTLVLNGTAVSLTVNNDSNGSSFVAFIFSLLLTQAGSDSDAVDLRMVYDGGASILPQVYFDVDISGGSTRPNSITLLFFDTIPASTTRTYWLQGNSSDTTRLRAAHGFGLLFKKS